MNKIMDCILLGLYIVSMIGAICTKNWNAVMGWFCASTVMLRLLMR